MFHCENALLVVTKKEINQLLIHETTWVNKHILTDTNKCYIP